MDIRQLKVFCSVYKNRSFSKASQDLLLSQPTISDHIKALEEALDSKLFDRLGRSIAPTGEALELYPRAIELIEKLEAIKSDIKERREQPDGQLMLGASTTPGTCLVPRAAAGFTALYPGIFFRLAINQSRAITNMVMEHELPLGIVSARMERKSLSFTPLAGEEVLLACAGDIIPEDSITPEDLMRFPLIVREEGSGTRKTVENYLQDNEMPFGKLRVVATLSSSHAMVEALKAGLGAGFLPRPLLTQELEKGTLREVNIEGPRIHQRFYIINHRKKTLPWISRLFIEYLKNTVNGA
ncbi:MAG: LysR family transcriptional regulator [Nitrospiraceae bacterium]|nr:LysR family transcriptional regulator [Nitrospiraceae bacterium]